MLGSELATSSSLLFWIPSLISFRYGAEVENYLEVYLRTPGLSNSDITRALLARGSARKRGGESLLVKAEHGTYHSPPPKFNLFDFFFSFLFLDIVRQIFEPS